MCTRIHIDTALLQLPAIILPHHPLPLSPHCPTTFLWLLLALSTLVMYMLISCRFPAVLLIYPILVLWPERTYHPTRLRLFPSSVCRRTAADVKEAD